MAKIQINYKSGQSIVVKGDSFTVDAGIDLTRVSWADVKPVPMFLGIDDIESIWEL